MTKEINRVPTKKEVQQRVLLMGKPLPLKDFTWDEETRTFTSDVDKIMVDFGNIFGCTFKTGAYCVFKVGCFGALYTGPYCTFVTGGDCDFTTKHGCTFKTWGNCTFDICGVKRNTPPARIPVNDEFTIEVISPEMIMAGCEKHSLEVWEERWEEIAQSHSVGGVDGVKLLELVKRVLEYEEQRNHKQEKSKE